VCPLWQYGHIIVTIQETAVSQSKEFDFIIVEQIDWDSHEFNLKAKALKANDSRSLKLNEDFSFGSCG
jgi:hypothetical protein